MADPAPAPETPVAQAAVDRLLAHLAYPGELPITGHRHELVAAIADHQVLIVAGETGSGKSTQLPKLCLEAGRGRAGLIGHTQPRRLAARSIAERVAEELGVDVGAEVGYSFRFNDRVGPSTRVKVMTDGILLAELQRDRDLRRYDTIIVDEAHERSLNIDFILGYLRQLLPRRPDLRVIVTSATIDTERFSHHFDDAPIVEVSGRTYPVEIRYRPTDGPDLDEPLGQPEAIARAVTELVREGRGDLLVFLAGERDIREAAEAVDELALPDTEVFPLFARLSAAEQHRVFASHRGRRIVLATNVAETSLTVPGIRYVIDPGNARISRYNRRTKVQRLPIEAVSQASADQRAGRCGRIGPGICIRLYAEDDYDARDEFTEPEILRTNLASVILQMASLGLGDIASFPFVEAPDDRSVTDGVQLLEELDALDPDHHGTDRWLTPMGRELARIPADPRFGRMIIEAADHGVLDDVTVVVAGLSIIDPRERPADDRAAADQAHARFVDDRSDFLTLLNLWDHVRRERRQRSSSGFRRLCRREYLNHNRVREWFDLHRQLSETARELGYRRGGNRLPDGERIDAVHRSILAGLLSHIGLKDPKADDKTGHGGRGHGDRNRRRPPVDYLGARQSRFVIAPGSALSRRGPRWVMAAELVETDRLRARMVGPIDPRWAEDLGHYLVTRSYTDPTWDRVQGVAHTTERVTLYGLPLVENRRLTVGRVDQHLARELFIHHALVEGDWESDHAFLADNRRVVAEVEELEARARRRDLLVEQRLRHEFFDRRLPDHIASGRHFDRWWKKARRDDPGLLSFGLEDLLAPDESPVGADEFPDTIDIGDVELELAYEYDTASHVDGVSVHVPIEVLNQLEPEPFEWAVPGLRTELVTALARSLPKATRRALLPIAGSVAAVLDDLDPDGGGLTTQVAHQLGRRSGQLISPDDFDLSRVPHHLRPTFRVINDRLEVLAEGKDLTALQDLMAEQVKASLSQVAATSTDIERSGITAWDFGDLPAELETPGPTHTIRAYPALVDEGDSVAIRLFADRHEQYDAMWDGTRRLIRLQLPSPVRTLDGLIDDGTKLRLAAPPVQSRAQWYNDCVDAAIDAAIADGGGPTRTRAGFDHLVEATRESLPEALEHLARVLADIVATLGRVLAELDALEATSLEVSVRDARAHLERLAYPGFVAGVGLGRLDDVARYLAAIDHRVAHLTENPQRDLQLAAACVEVEARHRELVAALGLTEELEAVTWQLEELRVASFAQHLKAPGKVSPTRIQRRLNEISRRP
jgi:ATP-dependent helicase HrpA